MTEATAAAATSSTDAAATPVEATTAPAAAAPATPGPAAAAPAAAPAEPAPKAADAPTDGKPVATGAPESYTAFTAPDGVTFDADLTTEFGTLAKGLNLSQADAQKVMDLGAKMVTKSAAQQATAVADVTKSWTEAAKTDKEFGGEKFDANLARANAAMTATATPQLKMLLDRTGLSNHPDVIRHFLNIAPYVVKDAHVPSGRPATPNEAAAKKLYPNMA